MAPTKTICPQVGPQTTFLSSSADIRIYGGSAGGGKSWSILLEALRGVANPEFNAVFFRRTYPMIRNPGGLWDASCQIYPFLGARPRESSLTWAFASGASVVFRHLKLDSNVYDWQGAEIPYIAFDELTHFTENQFWYMLSRNRSTCGIKPYMVGTCNPDADSWVRSLIDWWIGEDGLPIPERSGVVRYFYRVDDVLQWADTAEELMEQFGDRFTTPDGTIVPPKSLTFISATIYDNKELLSKDPGYLANLQAQSLVDRARLLGGNWNIKPTAGTVFRAEWFPILLDQLPPGQMVRFWDFAASERGGNQRRKSNKLDFIASVKMQRVDAFRFRILTTSEHQGTPLQIDQALQNTAAQDGYQCPQRWQRDPGQAGVYQDSKLQELLRGYQAMGVPSNLSKYDRAKPLSRAAERGHIELQGSVVWNQPFLNQLQAFPDGEHDDYVDSAAGAYNCLTGAGALGQASSGNFKA